MKKQQGFTLIELLVVIAIIGILSSIVIASLNSARTRGAVSAAKGGLAQIRSQAEVYFDGTGNNGYATTTCNVAAPAAGTAPTFAPAQAVSGCVFRDPTISNQLTQVASNMLPGTTLSGTASTSLWVVTGQLRNNNFTCLDNSGATVERATAFATGTVACV